LHAQSNKHGHFTPTLAHLHSPLPLLPPSPLHTCPPTTFYYTALWTGFMHACPLHTLPPHCPHHTQPPSPTTPPPPHTTTPHLAGILPAHADVWHDIVMLILSRALSCRHGGGSFSASAGTTLPAATALPPPHLPLTAWHSSEHTRPAFFFPFHCHPLLCLHPTCASATACLTLPCHLTLPAHLLPNHVPHPLDSHDACVCLILDSAFTYMRANTLRHGYNGIPLLHYFVRACCWLGGRAPGAVYLAVATCLTCTCCHGAVEEHTLPSFLSTLCLLPFLPACTAAFPSHLPALTTTCTATRRLPPLTCSRAAMRLYAQTCLLPSPSTYTATT